MPTATQLIIWIAIGLMSGSLARMIAKGGRKRFGVSRIPGPGLAGACIGGLLWVGTAHADNTDLAKQLSNPIASLISVPFQFNYDRGFGPEDGYRAVLNIQPVVPFELGEDWNLISRTILPVITQRNIAGRSGTQSGIGDITQSLFLSPRAPGPGGLIWGVGPVFLIPTATDDLLGTGKWGAGPTGVALRQSGPWTYGVLANHIWSFAGHEGRAEVSSTLLQPFLSYTTADAWTFGLNTESTYDWNAGEWSVPINFTIGKLVKFGARPVSFTAGVRYWAAAPDNGPEGFGFRGVMTLLFPK